MKYSTQSVFFMLFVSPSRQINP